MGRRLSLMVMRKYNLGVMGVVKNKSCNLQLTFLIFYYSFRKLMRAELTKKWRNFENLN